MNKPFDEWMREQFPDEEPPELATEICELCERHGVPLRERLIAAAGDATSMNAMMMPSMFASPATKSWASPSSRYVDRPRISLARNCCK